MTRLVYANAAERDLTEIALKIASDDPRAAVRFVASIQRHCHLLIKLPLMGRSRSEIQPGIRSFAHASYVVYYRHRDEMDQVEILRIWHSRRRAPQRVDLD